LQLTLSLRHFFQLCLLALAWPLLAYADLPKAANVPGGVAIVALGSTSAYPSPPQAWLGEQPIFVTADQNTWYAVVGLSLDLALGKHELRLTTAEETKTVSFNVQAKNYPKQYVKLKDKSKVELSATDQARAIREIAVIQEFKHHWRDSPDTDTALILPAKGKLGGRFGMRRYFNGELRAPHVGMDVVVPRDSPIIASGQGKVLAVDDYFFNGKTIFVDHGNGLITMYCHLNRIDVEVGSSIDKGQHLGLSGATGRATGPHLHWSVILNGVMVDPELLIKPF